MNNIKFQLGISNPTGDTQVYIQSPLMTEIKGKLNYEYVEGYGVHLRIDTDNIEAIRKLLDLLDDEESK